MFRNNLKWFIQPIELYCDHICTIRISRNLLNCEQNIILLGMYIPPKGSPYYKHSGVDCHLAYVESCLLDITVKYPEDFLICCGDLNSRTANYQIDSTDDNHPPFSNDFDPHDSLTESRNSQDSVLNEFGEMLLEICACFRLCILNGEKRGDQNGSFTYISTHGCSVVDYCIASYDFANCISAFRVCSRTESPHMPLSFEISSSLIFPDQNVSFEKVVWEKEKLADFVDLMGSDQVKNKLFFATKAIDESVNKALQEFTMCLQDAAKCMCKPIKIGNKPKVGSVWYDKECLDKKKQTRKALILYKKSASEADRNAYCDQRKQYKKLLNDKKTDYKEAQLKLLLQNSSDSQTFWHQVRRHRRKLATPSTISKNEWRTHFEQLLNFQAISDSPCVPNEPLVFDAFLDAEISESDVTNAFKHLKNNKAPGPDGIINEVLKASEKEITPFLVQYFNKIFNTGIFPEAWTKSIIVPIHKKGDVNNVDNYRGISLIDGVNKLFTHIINKRITEWAEANDVLCDGQAGFRRSYSTTDQIFTLYACIEKYLSRSGKFYVAYIDFRKAFDTVKPTLLWTILIRTGIEGKMLRILRSMYRTVQTCVRSAAGSTDYFSCLQGLKQGCLASPTLFSLFINELAFEIIQKGQHGVQFLPNDIEIFLLLFADDIALLSSTVIGLQNQLHSLHSAAYKLSLEVNLGKSKVMVFRKGGYLSAKEKWFYGTDQLEIVNSYRYLGLIFSTRLSFRIATCGEHLIKAKRGTIEILQTLRRLSCSTPKLFFKLFDSQIVPSLLYGAELWGFEEYVSIERVHIQACKLLLNVPTFTPNDMVLGELGRYPLYINSAIKVIKFWFRLLKQDNSRYSKKAYIMLHNAQQKDPGCSNWVSKVKYLLCSNGFGFVWMHGGVGDEKQFIISFRERLKNCFCQKWFSHLATSERFALYNSFKDLFQCERYLDVIHSRIYKTALTRLRCGVSRFNAHRMRFTTSYNERSCPFCANIVEDEHHILYVCPKYSSLRDKYPVRKFPHARTNTERVCMLYQVSDTESLLKVSKFLFCAVKLRENSLN